ncbi:MAG: helix-turn-helix domain-containing protein [Pyrinomonadaceae bacterium]|jgi:AraC-like DNA-binding protein|nr:helix-turn-helix domain-containing protein [Pyrinomonadaceae bacterium]
MQLIHFLPTNELLRQHIECYHITNYEAEYLKKEVLIYPHYFNAVSIFNGASSTFIENQFICSEQGDKKVQIVLFGGFNKPVLAKVTGKIRGLSIVFKPTGINCFIDKPFNEIVPEVHNNFPFWDEKADELEQLLYCHDISDITAKLEKILLSFYRPFENKLLFQILALLHKNYADYNVQELAQILKVSRKTLLRTFQKHIGVSITDYRRIIRFREAIKIHSGTDETLTRLAYETCFSDQSHFVKDIQKLTGDNPKKFFNEADFINDTPFFLKIK